MSVVDYSAKLNSVVAFCSHSSDCGEHMPFVFSSLILIAPTYLSVIYQRSWLHHNYSGESDKKARRYDKSLSVRNNSFDCVLFAAQIHLRPLRFLPLSLSFFAGMDRNIAFIGGEAMHSTQEIKTISFGCISIEADPATKWVAFGGKKTPEHK